jgi:DNA-directed RNA polymerase subunit RPC12/RpoP
MGDSKVTPRSLEPTKVPVCAECGTSMWVIRIEDDISRNLRTYYCPDCGYRTTIVVKHQRSATLTDLAGV